MVQRMVWDWNEERLGLSCGSYKKRNVRMYEDMLNRVYGYIERERGGE